MFKLFKEHIVVFRTVFFIWLFFLGFVLLLIEYVPFIKLNEFGVYGDSFNILTSLFTGLAFSGVIVSVVLQTQELKESREEFSGQKDALINQQKEMVNQSFDNKFFQLLSLFNTIRSEYSTVQGSGIMITVIFNRLYREIIDATRDKILLTEFIEGFEPVNNIETRYKYYFINLYQILKYIDKQNFDDKDAKFYTNIIRAQLSTNELIILFYYAYFISETHGENFKKLVEKYAFFEHLGYLSLQEEANMNITNKILLEYDISAFGKNKDTLEEISKLS